MRQKGLFISLEGIEGSGKSTQAKLLAGALEPKGIKTVLTVEPGGTEIGRRIRELLLSPDYTEMDSMTELLLYIASRRQHLTEIILPSLREGRTVITDRFSDSTVAYQGYARGIDLHLIDSFDRLITGGLVPDLTLLLDLDVPTGLKRNMGANKIDRFELESIEFHKRAREGYTIIAGKDPDRIKVIDASGEIETVRASVLQTVMDYIQKHRADLILI